MVKRKNKKEPKAHEMHFSTKISDKILERIRGIEGVIQATIDEAGFTVKKRRTVTWDKVAGKIADIMREEGIM